MEPQSQARYALRLHRHYGARRAPSLYRPRESAGPLVFYGLNPKPSHDFGSLLTHDVFSGVSQRVAQLWVSV